MKIDPDTINCPICKKNILKKVFNQVNCGSWSCKREHSRARSEKNRKINNLMKSILIKSLTDKPKNVSFTVNKP